MRDRYNRDSVNKAIDSAYRHDKKKPTKRQRSVIHSLLKGNQRDDK